MPSDIFIKTASGWASGLAKKIFIKTASSTWSAAKSVWLFFDAGWTRVWPLSGVYATRNPFVSTTSSSSELSSSTILRVGTTYRGNRGSWNPNGYTISSYQYKWVSYTYEDPNDRTTNYDPAMSTLSGTTNDFLITGTNYDKGWIVFFVTAKASGGTPYDGSAESFRYYVARQNPRLAVGGSPVFNIVNPKVGDTINYSASWDTSDPYKIEVARSTIKWYSSASNNLTESQLKSLIPVQSNGYSYVVKSSDSAKYIYAMEEVFNSGTDLNSLVNGVTAIAQTSSLVGTAPGNFTYSLTNVSSVTAPPTPIQQRVSADSNTVLIEINSSFPSDTESYNLWSYGSGSTAGGTLANPAVQTITTLNQYNSSGNFVPTGGSFDTITNISSSASTSPISTFSEAKGSTRTLQFNVSSTTGAQSWAINYTISGASGGNGTYTLNTNTMPRQTVISGASNPTVTINSITAYSGLDQQNASTAGSAGSPTSLSSILKPTSFSSTSTSYYSFYVPPVIPTITMNANTNVTPTSATINWTSTNQETFTVSGIFDTAGTTGKSVSVSGLSPSTTYTGTVTVRSTTGNTASANYSVTTPAQPVAPTGGIATVTPSSGTVGTTFNASTSGWSGTPTITYSYQWQAFNRFGFFWETLSTATSFTPTESQRLNALSFQLVVTASNGTAPNGVATTSFTVNRVVITPTITMAANSSVTSSSGRINWTSTNQAAFSVNGVFATSGTTATSAGASGLSPSTTYTGTVSISSSTGDTASADYSLTTLAAQYTVTWNANGGSGGGSTGPFNAGTSHTAPSPGTRSGYTFNGYYNTTSGDYLYGPIASGGSFTAPSNITMFARWTAIVPNVTQITALGLGNAASPYIRFTISSTNAASLSIMLYRSATSSTGPWTPLSSPSIQSADSGTRIANFTSRTGTTSNWYYIEVTPYYEAGGAGTAGTTRTSRVKRGTETTTTTVYP